MLARAPFTAAEVDDENNEDHAARRRAGSADAQARRREAGAYILSATSHLPEVLQ
jgi:hypothetical protein